MGIVCSIGNNSQEVIASLREAKSGIVTAEDYVKLGFRSQVHGSLKIDLDQVVDRRARRFQGDGAAYCWVAMTQAIQDARSRTKRRLQSTHRIDRGIGRPVDKAIVGAPITRRTTLPKRRSVRGAEGDVVHLLGQSFDLVQDQGCQLLDQLRRARRLRTASATRMR
jgi:3-oxoacyl-[acyl-carrier-protein] synthase-1